MCGSTSKAHGSVSWLSLSGIRKLRPWASLVAQMVKNLPSMQERCAMLCLVAQSCPTLRNPMDCSLTSSSVHGILQARILEWVATPFSRGPFQPRSFQPRDQTQVSHTAGRFFTSWATREACNVGDPGSVPGLGRSSGEGNGYPLQYSCLENSIDIEAWRTIVQRVAKSQTCLSDEAHMHTLLLLGRCSLC